MNGYLQIQMNGTPIGLRFAYPAIKWFTEASLSKADIYFVQADGGGFTVEGFAKLIECSYRNDCLVKEKEPTLVYEDFFNYVNDLQESEEGQKEFIRITEIYADSTVMKKIIDNQKKSQLSL